MGFFDRFRRKKKKDDLATELKKLDKKATSKPETKPRSDIPSPSQNTASDISNLRAKLDLILTEMDSLKTQNQTINERLKAIEKALIDMKGIKYY